MTSALPLPAALLALLMLSSCAAHTSAGKSATSEAVTIDAARTFMDRFIALGDAFDPAIADLYRDDAHITMFQTQANGQVRKSELTGRQFKSVLQIAMAPARLAGDLDRFTNIRFEQDGDNMRVLAERYGQLKCYTDREFSMVLAPGHDGSPLIVQESMTGSAPSLCGVGEGKTLVQRLEEISQQVASTLPRKVDDDTRLDRLTHDEQSLTYEYTLVQVEATELQRLHDGLATLVVGETCKMPSLRAVVNDGGRVVWVYKDRDAATSARFEIDQSACVSK